MGRLASFIFFVVALHHGNAVKYLNTTLDAASMQLLDFKMTHPRPIGVLTTSGGRPLDVRDTVTLNTDVFNNQHFWDLQSSVDHERIPERTVHSKGTAAFGYFVVTDDVSKYTKADLFNSIGKKTLVHARFSRQIQAIGGADLVRETGGIAVKFYTNEGNWDLLCLSFPVFPYRAPNGFTSLVHGSKRNPKTNLIDPNSNIDFLTKQPDAMHEFLWLHSDFGLQNGYRKMDAFAIQTYEVNNKHGESYFVRFNFRTEQGLELITDEAAEVLRGRDADYGQRDLYNAIATGNYPSWRLDMDVIPKYKIEELSYNPFDVTRTWKNGTYNTVTVGRMIMKRNLDNWFAEAEQVIYNPGNLVPGIPGPPDDMFKARRFAYRDTQSYRVGINHNNIEVNRPKYKAKTYNRDGVPPLRENMRDAPNYYQNSFNGPVPYVDESRTREAVKIYDRNAVDLEPLAEFYNTFVRTEGERDRMAGNIARVLVRTVPLLQEKMLTMLTLIDRDLGQRTVRALEATRYAEIKNRPSLVQVNAHPRTLDLHKDTCDDHH